MLNFKHISTVHFIMPTFSGLDKPHGNGIFNINPKEWEVLDKIYDRTLLKKAQKNVQCRELCTIPQGETLGSESIRGWEGVIFPPTTTSLAMEATRVCS